MGLRQEQTGGVLVLTMASPPVNALGHVLREALAAGIAQATADPGVRAVVLRAEGRGFSAGADIAEFGTPPRAPTLTDLCNQIEACEKPVVAALHGTALGGGMELALAAHYRLAEPGARLGLPEVSLGILPGAGGTQRLPRLIGAAEALRLMLTGKPVAAAEALALGIVDQLAETPDALLPAAFALAEQAGLPPRPTRDRSDGLRDPGAYLAAIGAARRGLGEAALPARARIIDCVEAAQLLSFDQGLAFERSAFADLVTSPEAAALRHAFFAERRATALPASLAGTEPPTVAHLGFYGCGQAGADLARMAVHAGLQVTVVETGRAELVAALERVAAGLEAEVAAGRQTALGRDADWARLTPGATAEGLGGADLVFHAGTPDLPNPGVELGGSGIGQPGLHQTPAPRVVELAAGAVTPPHLALVLAALRRIGLRAVLTGAGPGGAVGARVAMAGQRAAHWMADHGHPLGGVTRFGLRSPESGTAPHPDAGRRILGAMAAEGVRLLHEGVALRPSDIDMLMMAAHGFARTEGGPMFQADRRGLLVLRRDLTLWAADDPLWTPAPLLDELIRVGRTLDALNR